MIGILVYDLLMLNLIFIYKKLKKKQVNLSVINFIKDVLFYFNFLAFYYIAIQTGNWFKRYHIGEVRLKKLMKEICIMTEINLDNRKITNHAGRKTMVQAL